MRFERQSVASLLDGFRRHWIGGLLQRPFHSLPSRIIVSVFSAALVTGLAVTWISTRSIESFLRVEIDRKFPAILRSSAERLELWYSQRTLDVATFSRSSAVVEKLEALGRDRGAREDLSSYLAYVLEGFPEYQALLLMDPEGRTLLQVGEPLEGSDGLRSRMARVAAPLVGPILVDGDRRVQIASAPVVDDHGRRLATLHAVLRVPAVEAVLIHPDLGPAGGVYVLGEEGQVLLRSPGSRPLARLERTPPQAGTAPAVAEYAHPDGSYVVGSSLGFDRFGWTLVVEESYEEAFAPVVGVMREILGINLSIVLVFGLIAYLIARSIVRPILALSEAASRLGTGETDVVIEGKPTGDEIGVLTRAFNEMSSRLHQNQLDLEANRLEIEDANSRLIAQNQELQRVNEVFQQLSITDDLTRLHNHRFFQDHLPREIKRSLRTGEPLCLILIDIDDFKKLNDRFGHAVGDAVLRRVADVLSDSVREMDLLARYGGEEFVLLASRTALEGAVVLAEKMRMALARARFSLVDLDGPKDVSVTASFGVAQFRGDENALFNDADRALYSAKARGKDCVVAAGAD